MKLPTLFKSLKLTQKQRNATPQSTAPSPLSALEALPIELRILILSFTTDITTLRNLIHSSPSYHSAYLASRPLILINTLLASLPPSILIDALAIHQASLLPRDEARADRYRTFASSYKADRVSEGHNNEKYLFSVGNDAVFGIARMHSIVLSATRKYFESMQPNTKIPLSELEKTRIMRGFYRFQLFVELFSDVKDDRSVEGIRSINRANGRMFLTEYPPWEGEEVACIAVFLAAFYTKCLESCTEEIQAWDLENPSDVIRDEAVAERWIRIRAETQLEILLKQGLPFFHSLPSHPQNIWDLIQPHIIPIGRTTAGFISHALRNDPYFGHIAGATDDNVESTGNIPVWGWLDRKDLGSDRKRGYVFWDVTRKGCFKHIQDNGELDEWKIWDVRNVDKKSSENMKGKKVNKGVKWWLLGRSRND